jgi:hypothetical protein
MVQTAAQQRVAGVRNRLIKTRSRVKRRKVKAKARVAKRKGKPRPGTKAWMAYIRTKRKK